jgi:hypothetical protein
MASTGPVGHPKYQRFVTMRDDTGALATDVPVDWSDQRTNGWHPGNIPGHDGRVGPGMNAAPNAADWFDDATTPGVFVGASSLLAREMDPKQLLEVLDPQGCILADERSYAARGLSGKQQTWNCRSYQWFHLAARPDDRSYLVFVEVKLVDPRDEAARDQVLTSLQVTGTPA